MNDEALAHIENGWAAASGGPWTVVDFRDEDTNLIGPLTSAQAVDRFLLADKYTGSGEHLKKLENFTPKKREDLKPKDDAEYVSFLEKIAYGRVHLGHVFTHFRVVVTQPPSKFKDILRSEDNFSSIVSFERCENPPIAFAVLESAKQEDVDFIVNAARDMGTLIEEVRRRGDKVKELSSALREAKAEIEGARKRERETRESRDRLNKLASSIIEQLGT